MRVLDNPEKIAPTGLNRAIREARGEIIIRMDAHTTYAPDYVRSCVEVLQETNADNVGGPALTRADGYIAQAIAHAYHTRFATGGARFRDPQYKGPVDSVVFGCWRKSTLQRIGLFDVELVRGQDYELNARLISCGGTLWQSPKITFWYRPRASLSGLFRQYFQNGFWKVALIRKHPKFASRRNLVPGPCLLMGVVIPLCAAVASLYGSAFWRHAFLDVWFGLVGLYLIASCVSAFSVAKREGWKFLPSLPIVFATYQFSYALGFLLALLHRPAAWERPTPITNISSVTTK
jgi:cellulose synthase/poly-beta-1,6-N-acetylglucosamine synthase-like glycosyltransferase